jgi:predicted small secreted protein
MKKSIFLLAIVAVIAITLPSCVNHVFHGEGAKITKTTNLAPFSSVEISINSVATINVQPGAQPSIEILAYGNHQEHILTKVENNKLTVYDNLKPHWTFGPKREIELKITVGSLDQLELNGATEANIHGNLTGKEFGLDISGAVKVTMDSMNVTSFKADLSGAADIIINGGSAQTAEYEISGAGKVKAFPFKTSESTMSISGAAKAEVTANDKLTVEISGAGKVAYKGHPVITKDISGAGTITDAN